jgi:dTDP-4-dehydrorhamnose reductase
MKVLVLGAAGMLGNAVMRVLSENTDWLVYGTVRSESAKRFFRADIAKRLLANVNVEQHDSLVHVFSVTRPDVVVNCVGLIKQLADAENPLLEIPINAVLPHRLARLCEMSGARLVHISTDCVFAGEKGGYCESDPADAKDLYGRTKFLGEVNAINAITLRTSIIGHELQSTHGLIDWFLAQQEKCKGYTRAIFSGVPTVILARFIRDIAIPQPELFGVYHVAAHPISKYDLLTLVAGVYGKQIEIMPDNHVVIDRSLNADRILAATGYAPPDWPEMIRTMHDYR